jgi:hypothetical protein
MLPGVARHHLHERSRDLEDFRIDGLLTESPEDHLAMRVSGSASPPHFTLWVG